MVYFQPDLSITIPVVAEKTSPITMPTTPRMCRELCNRLLGREITEEDRPDGKLFRKNTVKITDGLRAVHTGINGEEEILHRIQIMLDTQNGEDQPRLINAVAAHFMLEHTHPLYDGNGRFGRFILVLRLSTLLSLTTALSLFAEIMRQKSAYYRAFLDAENPLNRGEGTFFVEQMLQIVSTAQERQIEPLIAKQQGLAVLRNSVDIMKDAYGNYQRQVLHLLGQVWLFGPRSGVSLKEITTHLNKSQATHRLPRQGSCQGGDGSAPVW